LLTAGGVSVDVGAIHKASPSAPIGGLHNGFSFFSTYFGGSAGVELGPGYTIPAYRAIYNEA